MKTKILTLLNTGLVAAFVFILRKQNLLSYYSRGRWRLTWLSVAIITLMDELTSVFYVTAEAHRFIGLSAIFFIALTSLFIPVCFCFALFSATCTWAEKLRCLCATSAIVHICNQPENICT